MAKSTTPTPVFVIIDGNAIIHRAYHAIPPLTTKTGQVVNAVYGFANILLRVLKELQPTHMAVTFDLAGPTFRDELSADYKATRVEADPELYAQIPVIHELVEAFALPIVTKAGFEADDCIGTLVERIGVPAGDIRTIIVTGDMDTLQLVTDRVQVYTMRKSMNDTVIFDIEAVAKRYPGLTPAQVIEYKALAGDHSDNIPGVRGIGEKTAVAILQKFPNLEALYAALDAGEDGLPVAQRKKLIEGRDSAFLSRQLATIRRDVPMEASLADFVRRPVDETKLVELLQRCEFTSLISRIPGLAARMPSAGSKAKQSVGGPVAATMILATGEEVKTLVERLAQESWVVVRTHTSSTVALDAEIYGLGLAIATGESWYVPTSIKNWQDVLSVKTRYVGHDCKHDVAMLLANGCAIPERLFDVMVGSYLLHSESNHELQSLALKYLGERLDEEAQGQLFGKDQTVLMQEVSVIARVAEPIRAELQETNQLDLYERIEEPLLAVLARMELAGIAIDVPLLKKLAVETDAAIAKCSQEIYDVSGTEFNISSNNQLRDVLFDTLQLPTYAIKKGKTGYSTAASELEKLRGLHPIIEFIESYRELTKLKTTYIDVLPTLTHARDHRIHTTFNQTVAATGRLSSTDPNVQNIPIRTEAGKRVRTAFIAEPGNVLVAADYSQIELRIVASLAEDAEMIRIFEAGEDIHRSTAARIHGVELEAVTHDMRRSAKEINFGVLYGMGAFGLASRTGITQHEAQDFINRYFEVFSGVRKYLDATIAAAKRDGYVETLFGRRRYLPEMQSGNYQVRAAAERMAVNHPVQGTAADLMKLAMIAVDRLIQGDKNTTARMLLQVHDELILEVAEQEAAVWEKRVKEAMEQVMTLRVPIIVEAGHGHSWGETKE